MLSGNSRELMMTGTSFLHSEKEWKRRREELEKTSERATQEVSEINKAMEELRDALDESEKQARGSRGSRRWIFVGCWMMQIRNTRSCRNPSD